MVGVVLGTLAQECQGGFASKPRPVERVRRAQVKQFTAACRAPQYDGDYFYAFTAVSNGEKVMMLYNSSELGAADLEQVNLAMLDALHILRSEEHTSELQSLMRISYAVFCLKKKTKK